MRPALQTNGASLVRAMLSWVTVTAEESKCRGARCSEVLILLGCLRVPASYTT